MSRLGPTPEQIAALAARPSDEPVVMVNLLTFKADVGRDSYLRYAREVVPHLARVGATLRYAGSSPTTVIGDGVCPGWDAILVVEYPSPQAFIDMVSDAEYVEIHEYRVAGLEHGDLIATSRWNAAG